VRGPTRAAIIDNVLLKRAAARLKDELCGKKGAHLVVLVPL
jgi:hypothetical protein